MTDAVIRKTQPVQSRAEDKLLLDKIADLIKNELTEEQRNVIVL